MDSPFLLIKSLSASFANAGEAQEVLANINIELDDGEFAAIIGPSGCGKSTLFNVLTGLAESGSGQVFLEGELKKNLLGSASYMQQKDLLLPWRTVLENAVLGMEIKKIPGKTSRGKAIDLLDTFGLKGCENQYPAELSGGMRQRVALLRTILCEKKIILLDEPFGSLDAITRRRMQKWLLSIWENFKTSMLLVTHDVEEALILAGKIYVLSSRPARVKAELIVNHKRPRKITSAEMVRLKETILELLDEE